MKPSCLGRHFLKEDLWFFFLVCEQMQWSYENVMPQQCLMQNPYWICNMIAILWWCKWKSFYANVLHADANANVYACDVNVCTWNVYCKNPYWICRHECNHMMAPESFLTIVGNQRLRHPDPIGIRFDLSGWISRVIMEVGPHLDLATFTPS